jgi:alpha-2-macroglobulin
MNHLGIFGESVAEDTDNLEALDRAAPGGLGGGLGGITRAAGPVGQRMMMKDGAAAPPAPMAAMTEMSKESEQAAAPGAELVAPTVRKNFADSAFWAGSLTTDADGVAVVSLTMPENLTAWKIKTWGMGQGTQVGEGEVEVTTKKNLLVRLQAPRFFIQKDEAW